MNTNYVVLGRKLKVAKVTPACPEEHSLGQTTLVGREMRLNRNKCSSLSPILRALSSMLPSELTSPPLARWISLSSQRFIFSVPRPEVSHKKGVVTPTEKTWSVVAGGRRIQPRSCWCKTRQHFLQKAWSCKSEHPVFLALVVVWIMIIKRTACCFMSVSSREELCDSAQAKAFQTKWQDTSDVLGLHGSWEESRPSTCSQLGEVHT